MHADMHVNSSHKVSTILSNFNKNFTGVTRTWRHIFKLGLILVLAMPQL